MKDTIGLQERTAITQSDREESRVGREEENRENADSLSEIMSKDII